MPIRSPEILSELSAATAGLLASRLLADRPAACLRDADALLTSTGCHPPGSAVPAVHAVNHAVQFPSVVLDAEAALDDLERAVDAHRAARRRAPVVRLGPGITMAFVLVPAGPFQMGSTEFANEQPIRTVQLDTYLIGKYPVTVAQFAAFVRATGYKAHAHAIADVQHRGEHPVTHVTWHDAVAFCAWASQRTGTSTRLPTEAEWEKAARGTDGRRYPWGNEKPDDTRCRFGKWRGGTTPVGQFSPRGDSPYGLADMAGNVCEWCADWYDGRSYARSGDRNPPGPGSGTFRVVRGGSWAGNPISVRAAYRTGFPPDARPASFGFRCARSM